MRIVPVLLALILCPAALAQVGADGIDWCTIGAAGNRAYDGPDPFNLVAGHGSVGYDFKMGRTEITTEQWLGFFNAALARPDPLPFVNQRWWGTPILWGATRDTAYTGPGTRYRLRTDIANAGMLPVSGISWRMAAILCNYYEHGRDGSSAANFMAGSYDVSTFAPEIPLTTFTDQPIHTAGAHYWIPTLDEWMKAVHYDPTANGGAGRWWQQPNGTDTPLIYGPPPSFGGDGTGQANSGFTLPNNAQYQIPLGAYPTVQSPWGLLDAAGATAEWLETISTIDTEMDRGVDGTTWVDTFSGADAAYSWGQLRPHLRLTNVGLRLASSVPAPSSALTFLFMCGICARRKR